MRKQISEVRSQQVVMDGKVNTIGNEVLVVKSDVENMKEDITKVLSIQEAAQERL